MHMRCRKLLHGSSHHNAARASPQMPLLHRHFRNRSSFKNGITVGSFSCCCSKLRRLASTSAWCVNHQPRRRQHSSSHGICSQRPAAGRPGPTTISWETRKPHAPHSTAQHHTTQQNTTNQFKRITLLIPLMAPSADGCPVLVHPGTAAAAVPPDPPKAQSPPQCTTPRHNTAQRNAAKRSPTQ